MNKVKKIALSLSFLLANTVYAQNIEGEIELDGFVLGQSRVAVHSQLGHPIQRVDTDDGWIYEFHAIRPDTSVYVLFKYPAWDTLRIFAIQLNGRLYKEMQPFKGLTLGSSRDEVSRALGPFNATDTIDNPNVVIQSYKDKNFSVEIDEDGKLYGIQIYGSIQNNKPKEDIASIDGFTRAVLSKNVDSLLLHLMPDVEFYVNQKVVTYRGAAREEFRRRDSELIRYLLGKEASVWYAFQREKTEATPEIRFYAEIKSTTTVFKFYKSEVLSEIVYKPHAGRWKVYEIAFRN
jgi:hypothetical protein